MATNKPSSEGIRRLNELLERASQNDARAFTELYNLTKHKMRMILLSVNPSSHECEDILQEGYVKIWRHAASFDSSRASPVTWMSAIMRNTAIDTLRRRRQPTSDLEEALSVASPQDPSEWDDFDYDFTRSIVSEALNALSEDRRKLVELAYVAGESREVLSRRFGVPVGTVKTWLRRALETVRRECLAAPAINAVPAKSG
jgi:RNA polymerase sigma-70 factor, ECF subfamily